MPSLSQRADRATSAIQGYQAAHVQMAAAAEKVLDMVEKGAFTPAEGIEALSSFARQYRAKLRAVDERAGR